MADPRNINQSAEDARRLDNNLDSAKVSFDELLFSARDFSNEVAKAAKSVFQNSIQASEQAKSFKTLASLSKDFASEISDIADGTKSISNFNKLLVKQEEAKKKFNVEYRQALSQAGASQEKIKSIVEDQLSIYDVLGDEIDNLNEDQQQLLKYYEEQSIVLKDQEKTLEQIEGRSKQIEDAFGGFGKIAEGLEAVLKKIGASKLTERLGISDAVTKSRQFAADLTKGQEGPATMVQKIGNQFKVLGNLAGNVGSNLLKSLGPVPIIIGAVVKLVQFLVSSMFEASKQIAEFQRDMGLTAEEAKEVRQNTYEISVNSSKLADTQGKILILQKQIVQAQKEANDALDTQVDFTKDLGIFGAELLVQSAILRDNFGLSAETVGELTNESIRTGLSVEDNTKKILGNVAAVGLEKNILLDTNKILTEAAKIQGNIRLSFKGSTNELAKGVAQAKLMGLTLKQNEGIARNLLNFEDSIASELEAELLTGMNINLEKARLAALNGDLVEVGKEINNQGITYNKLQSMNLLQRDALAKSLGLTTDELADTLKKQQEYNALQARSLAMGVKIGDVEKKSLKQIFEENKKLGRSEEEVVKALGDELYQRKLAEDAQTKFNKALDLAKESLSRLVEGGALDALAGAAQTLAETLASGGSLFTLFGKSDLSKNLEKKSLEQAYATEKELKNKKELTDTEKSRLEIAQKRIKENSDEEYEAKLAEERASARSGRIHQGSANEIKTRDYILKTLPEDTVVGAGGTRLGRTDEMVSLLKELIGEVKRGGHVYLDGNKVGTALLVSSHKTQ